jgi:hypothetical protein
MLEIKSYDDWTDTEEELQAEPVENLKRYANYVRSGYYKAGLLNEENEREIILGVKERAKSDGLITGDMPEEEQDSYISSVVGPSQNADTNAKFLLDHLRTGSESGVDPNDTKVTTLSSYLASKQVAPDQPSDLQPIVDELLSDASLIKRAKMSAVDRGEYSVAAIDEDGGGRSLYTGPTAKPDSIKGEVDSLLASGAISPSDLYRVDKAVSPINGGLSNTSENFRYEMFRRTVSTLAKTDKDLGDLIESSASKTREEKLAEQRTTGESIWEGVKTAVAYPFLKLADVAEGAVDFVTGEEDVAPAFKPETKVSDVLAENEELRKKFSAEEIEKFSEDLTTTAAGAPYRADRPDSGISSDSMGNIIIAPQLLANKQLFETAVTTAPLNAEQQTQARAEREVLLTRSAPELLRVILEEEPEAAGVYAKAKASGLSNEQFIEQWVSTPQNYDGFSARLEQFGKSAWKTVAEIPVGIAALSGNEWSAKYLGGLAKDQSRRAEYSRLFGDEFGVGFQIINAIPQVAADIGLTIGTGGAFAGAKALAKTASLSSSSLLRASTKVALSNVDDAATLAYKSAAVAGGEANVGAAIKNIGASLATNFVEQAPVFTTAFVRSASSTYGSIYSQLPDTLSHEDKHKNALGYSLAAGLSTGVITAGMGFLGRGGVEEIATKRVRAMLAGETDESILASGAKVVPVDKMNYRQAKQVYENLKNESRTVSDATFQKAMRSAIGSTYKNWLRTTLKGGLNESIEEAMDQGIQMKLEDASLDKETPLSQRVSQVFTAGLIGGTMGGAMGGATQFGKVKKSEMALVYEGRASALDNVVKDLRKNNSGVTADFVERMMDDARAKANAAVQEDVLAQTAVTKAKGTEAVADPKEKPVVPIDTFLQAFFGKPKEAAVEQPETTTFLNDLIGEPVSYGTFSGTLEISEDQENVRLKLDKPYKQKGGEPVTHINLGPRLQKADSIITKYPTLMRTGDDVFGVKAGTPYFLVGSTKEKFAAKPLSEGAIVDDRFTILRDDEGVVRSITIKDAVSLKNVNVSMPVSVSDPSIIRAFAKEYGIDVAPLAPVIEGQQQFGFAEGEIKDAEAPTEEGAVKGTEGQLEFNLDQTPEQQATQAVIGRFDAEIADLKEKIKDPSINDVRRERLQDRLKGIQKAKRSYSPETIQMGMLNPDEQALFNSPDVEWNAKLDLIRNAYDVNPNVAGATKRILAALLRNKIGSAIAFGDLDYDTLEAVRNMANEIISFANDEDNQVSDKIRSETRNYYSNLLNRVDIAREFIDERDIDLIKQDLENESFRVTQQLQKPEPKPYPVTNTLHYLLSNGKLKAVDIVAGLEAEGDTGSLTKQTLTGFKYIPETREIEFADPASDFVTTFKLSDIDVSSKGIQAQLKKSEVKAKEFIKQEKLAAKNANKVIEFESEEETEPEAPLDERVTGFLNLVNDYVNQFNELNKRVTLLKRSKVDQARVKDELKVIRSEANQTIKENLTSLVGEIKSRNDLQEGLRSEMIDQISTSIFGKGGFTPVSGSKAQFGKIIEPSLSFKTTAVDYPVDKFRIGTQEEALFNMLVESGQVVNLPTTGATIATATSMFTTSNGLIKRPAFSEAIVEQVTEEGQEVARPNSYIRDKNNLLRERVHKAYPPLGSIQYKAEGPQGAKVNPKLEAQLRSKQVELSNTKTKAETKGFNASDKIAVLSKEIAELKKQVKDVPKYKIGRASYDMVRSQEFADQFYPVTEYEINGEAKTYGVFTNDIEITRAQIAAGLHIVIPTNFKGVLNRSIHIAQDGVTVDGYYEPARDNPVMIGQFRSKLDTRRDSGEEPIDKTRATKYDARAELLVDNMVAPMDNKAYKLGTSGLIQTVFDGAKRFLYSNAFSPTPDAKLPLTTKGIEDAATEALTDFTSQLNEFLLSRHIVTKVISSLDWQNRIKSQEGQELITRALGDNSSNLKFSDLPKELRRLLIKEDSGNLTDAVKGTNLSRYVREMFNGLDDATIAKNITKLGIRIGGGDPTSVMKEYGMYLFQNATSIEGKFFTVPNPREYLVRTKAIGDKTVKVLGEDFSTIANKHAKRERAEAEELPSMSIDAIEEAFGGDFEFSELVSGGAGVRPDWQILLDASQRQKEMGLSLRDYTDNSFNERFGILLSSNDHVFNDRGSMLASELMAAVKSDKELGKTFRDIAKMVGLDTPAELAKISDEFLVNVLSKKLSDDALFRTNNGYASIVMSQLSGTEVGQRAAGLMILKGWLPPVMIEGKQVPLRAPSERENKAPAAAKGTPPKEAIALGKLVRTAEATGKYVTTIEEAEAYEANKNVALARVAGTIAKLGEEKAIALQTIEEARARISGGFKILEAIVQPKAGESALELAQNDFWTNSATVSGIISDFTREQTTTIADEISSLEVKLSNYEKLQKTGQRERNKDLSSIDKQIKKYVKALADPRLPDDSDEKTIFRQKYDELNSLKYHITFNGQSVIDGLNSSISLKQKEIDRINKAVGNGATLLENTINDIESSLRQLNNNREYISRLSDKSKSVVNDEISYVEYLMGLPEWKNLAVATANHPAQLKFKTNLTPEQRGRVDKYNTSLKVKQDYDAFATQQRENLRGVLAQSGVNVFNSGLLTTYVDPVDVVPPEFFEEETTSRPQAEIDENLRQFAEAISPARTTTKAVEVPELPTRATEGGKTKVLSKVRPVSYESEIPSNAVDYPTRMTNEGVPRILPRVRSIDRMSIDFALSTLDPSLREAARQENTRMMNELGLVSGDSDSILRALSVLSNRGTAQQQAIVLILNAAPDLIRSVNIGIVDMQAGFAGLYDKSNNTILLNLSEHNGRGLADVLLHELIHATTVRVINNPTTAKQREAVQRLEQIRNFALAAAVKKGIDTDPTMQFGLSTVEEFVTYALTAPEFMPLLNGLTKPQERTIIRRMIDAILSIFGFEPQSRQQTSNAIDELLDFTKMSLAHSNTFNMDARWASTLRNEPSENAKTSNITRLKSAQKIQQTLRNVAEDSDMIAYAETQGQGTVDAISEIQRILPEGITLEFDNTMLGQLGARRSRPNSIIVNPDTVNDLIYNLTPANARSAVRTFVDEELAHLASYRTFTEDDFVSIAAGMGEDMRNLVVDMLYSNSESDFARRQVMIADDLASGTLRESDIAAEWVRSEMTRIAVGRSREENLAFLRTNPSLLAKFIEAVQAFITKLKAQFVTNPTASTAAKISMAARQFRSLRNGGVLPVPEPSTAGELGDTTHFINAVEGNIAEGQEDRTSFNLPIASTNPSKVADFWKKMQEKMYDMPLELRRYVSQRDGAIASIEYTMEDFAKRYPKLRDEAIAAGIAIEDIGTVLGTTAPAVQGEARKELQRKVRQFKADNASDPNITRLAEDYEAKLAQPIADKFYAEFRKNQKVMEDQLKAKGFGPLVDYLVEFRQEINKYKQMINFDESNDVYLTRTYNYLSTEGWSLAAKSGGVIEIDGKTVDFDKLRAAAAEHFRSEVLFDAKQEGQTLTEEQVARKTIAYLDKYLKKLDEQAAESKELGSLNTIKRDVNRLLRKKDFDAPLRELLGEVTNPFENAVRTIYSVGLLAANDRFLRNFARQATKSGLASRERTDGMELLFHPSQNAELGDLAGLYVRSDVAAAVRQELGPKNRDQETRSMEFINSIGKGLSWASGAAVTTQTLGSVGFYPRNILGGMALSSAQGIINPLYAKEATRLALMANLLESDSKETRDTIRRLVELQILRDETRGRMAMDMLKGFTASKDEQLDELLNELVEAEATGNMSKIIKRFNLKEGAATTVEFLASLNNVIDSAFKVNAYMYELDQLKKAYGNESIGSLEVQAARKAKFTFPTHSDQMSVAKSFNKSPFSMVVLPFIRWKSEVIRTMLNTIPLAMEEINSGNDVMKARGIKRLIGFSSTVLGGSTAFGLVFGTLFSLLTGGKDDEDKELGRVLTNEELSTLREGLPDWQKNHGVFARLVGKDGIQVIDMSNILPHSQVTDIFKLGAQGNIKGVGEYIAKDLIGTQIAANALFEVSKNQDGFGNPIALQSDNIAQAYGKLFWHAAKSAFAPSAIKKGIEVFRYGQQDAGLLIAGELTGARPIVMKKSDIEYRAMSKIRTAMDEDLALLNPIYSARGFDVGDVGDQVGKYQSATNVTQGRLYDFIQGMKSLGSTEEGLITTGKRARISNQRLGYAIAGENYSWVPNEAAFKKIIENKTRGGEQDPMPLVDELIRVTAPNKPINYNVAQPFIK